ncbi:MAG: Radical domain protein [Chlamydiales bacterium]|jgi:DNA repair photolyase|nr:Radical domain protein [Chlamydiales bacterium]
MRPHFKKIYLQKTIRENMLWNANAQDIINRFPEAEIIEVDQHWRIPALVEASPSDWFHTKNDVLVLGIKAGLTHQKNGRSSDYIAASISNGCLSACQYCYVARRKGGSNPLTIFVNIEEIANSIDLHQQRLGPKKIPNQTDPFLWTYDIGCNADLSLDALVCDHPGYLIRRFAKMQHAKATFATKTVNDDYWLQFDPQGHTRIRYSIMPQHIAKYVDIRTSRISERISSVNRLVAGGYEVHLNFSPIIIYGGEQWKHDWLEIFKEIDGTLTFEAKKQLACEAFFLSHSTEAHETNLKWNPKGEEYLWRPSIQVKKKSKPDLLVYDYDLKNRELTWFKQTMQKFLPYCPIRYSF